MGDVESQSIGALLKDGALEIGDGYRAKLDDLGNGGPLFLRAGALTSGGFAWDRLESFKATARVQSKRGQVADVVITTKGNSIGRVGAVPKDAPDFVYSPHLSYWRVKDLSRLNAGYLYYWTRSPGFTSQLRQLAFGTDMAPYFSLRDQLRVVVPIPPLREQLDISEVLTVLDEKIAANERVLDLTDHLVAAQYEYLLSVSGQRVLLGNVAEFHNRKRMPLSSRDRESLHGAVPYYGAASRMDYVDQAIFNEPLVLVGEDGSVMTSTGAPVVQYIWGPSWVNNHAHVLTGRGIATETLRSALLRSTVAHLVTGAVQPKISMGNLKSLELELPTATATVDKTSTQFAALTRSVTEENDRLTTMRDELLPLLMSGKITVKAAESIVEEVV